MYLTTTKHFYNPHLTSSPQKTKNSKTPPLTLPNRPPLISHPSPHPQRKPQNSKNPKLRLTQKRALTTLQPRFTPPPPQKNIRNHNSSVTTRKRTRKLQKPHTFHFDPKKKDGTHLSSTGLKPHGTHLSPQKPKKKRKLQERPFTSKTPKKENTFKKLQRKKRPFHLKNQKGEPRTHLLPRPGSFGWPRNHELLGPCGAVCGWPGRCLGGQVNERR